VATQRTVIWTPGARIDLDDIVAYIANDSPSSAHAFLEAALDAAESLDTLSERGRVVPELDDPNVRELFVKRYRLLYEIQKNEIHILGFVHGARKLQKSG